MGQPQATAHRVIRDLRALGVVEPILKVPQRRAKRSGPMPKVWGLMGHCSDEEIRHLLSLVTEDISITQIDQDSLDYPDIPQKGDEQLIEIWLHLKTVLDLNNKLLVKLQSLLGD